MKPRSAKAKGRRLQKEVQLDILERFPHFELDDARPAIMGESGVDIKLSPYARKHFPYSIECKNQEKLNIWKTWEQAKSNTKDGTTTLAVVRRNHHEKLVIMTFDHFLDLFDAGISIDK